MADRHDIDTALERARSADSSLLDDLRSTELDPSSPSQLDGWTIGHLLTHIARNADSVVRRLKGCAEHVAVTQYEGGPEGRAAEIEAGATRSYVELVDDVAVSAAAIPVIVSQLDDAAFDFMTFPVSGPAQDGLTVLRRRSREVHLHHSDLGIGFTASSWPSWLVEQLLDDYLGDLTRRSDPAALAGWLVDRGPAPSLAAWNGGVQAT